MLKRIEIDGKQMVAVVLGDTFEVGKEEIKAYQDVLFEVLEFALLNSDVSKCTGFDGVELFNYMKILRAFMGEVQGEDKDTKKGGTL